MGRKIDDLFSGLGRIMNGFIVCFLVVPLIVTALMAFDARSYLGPLPPPALSTRWFSKFFSDDYFLRGLGVSLELALITVCFSVCIGVITAVALARGNSRARELMTTLFLSPLIVPPVVTGFAILIFLSKLGVVNGFARLLCGHLIITIPYTIRATLNGVLGIDKSLTEAALTLGARERHAFWDITFPLARTGIICGGIFAFVVSLDDVAISIMLTDAKTYTLPVALVSSMRANFDLTLAAVSVLLMGLTLALILVLEKTVGLNQVIGQGTFR